jgi:hypothetical protein
MPDMRVEGSVTITTEEEARKNPKGKNVSNEEFEVGKSFFNEGKSRIFTKNDDKNTNLLKSKLEFDDFETTPKK